MHFPTVSRFICFHFIFNSSTFFCFAATTNTDSAPTINRFLFAWPAIHVRFRSIFFKSQETRTHWLFPPSLPRYTVVVCVVQSRLLFSTSPLWHNVFDLFTVSILKSIMTANGFEALFAACCCEQFWTWDNFPLVGAFFLLLLVFFHFSKPQPVFGITTLHRTV